MTKHHRTASTYIAAIDQGTSSTRVILYDQGTLVPKASHQVQLSNATSTPQAGWVQMNPAALLLSVENCFQGVLEQVGATAQDVTAVGITNQRESLVVWDRKTGEALHECILWLDTRTRDIVGDLEQKLGSTNALRNITGLPLSTYFTGVKLKWMMDNVPLVRQAIERGTCQVGTVDAFLAARLTGVHVTDVTNASRTLMMDLHTCSWSNDAIEALDLPSSLVGCNGESRGVLPRIVGSAEHVGTIKSGTFEGVPLTGIIGDQQGAMVGQRCFESGMAKTTYGTGAFCLMNTGNTAFPSNSGLLTTALYSAPGELDPSTMTYALEGAVGSCAVGINWFSDKLKLFDSPMEMDKKAAQALGNGGTSGLYFVSAFGGLLAPHWRDDARGTLVGLTLAHDDTHICLSILEGIAFQVRDVVNAMVQDTEGRSKLVTMKVDGGVCKSDPLLQSQANFLGRNVIRPQNVETTAMGAAIVTGAGAGLWERYEDSPLGGAESDDGTIFVSMLGDKERQERVSNWQHAVQSSLNWAGRT